MEPQLDEQLMSAFHPKRTLEGLTVQLLQLQPFTLLCDEQPAEQLAGSLTINTDANRGAARLVTRSSVGLCSTNDRIAWAHPEIML
jgi:hypothetical protein